MKNNSLINAWITALTWAALTFAAANASGQSVTVSGTVLDKESKSGLPFANVVLKTLPDSAFNAGTITDEEGRFTLSGIKPGEYFLEVTMLGYDTRRQALFAGSLSGFLNVPPIEMEETGVGIADVVITGSVDEIGGRMDKKSYAVEDNITQSGGSVLQAMQNLPGVTVQDGKVQLRGNDKVVVLIDGKQTALTGFGNQSGLDNIPASSIERIEIINNPSARYDANGNGGIINIVFKKEKQEGFNGKLGFSAGLGALWVRRENLPSIRPQYRMTPKMNPSLSLNYRKGKVNLFVQADNLYTRTLNKNEFVTREYDDGTVIQQQTKRNRITNFLTTKAGFDLAVSQQDMLTVSGLFGTEKIIDRGDEPFFNEDLSERLRLWQFLEDELKTTAMGTAFFQHKFKEPGHLLNAGFNYTFHREDEKYFFTNTLPAAAGTDAFKLISDERVADIGVDYIRPLRHGRIEAGGKFRRRTIPTDMQFLPGINSVLDTNAGGKAIYKESNPAMYCTYVLESRKVELEAGLRMEYVQLRYEVDPNHNTYKSDGYDYAQPFPTLRMAYKFNDRNKLVAFYNRRVDRPNEVDIRVFPKYDDAEIIKVGNPALQPQFSNAFEVGYKSSWQGGYLYAAAYHRISNGTITRIASTVAGSNLIYAVFQNAGRSQNSGTELVLSQEVSPWYSFNINLNGYRNQIDAFSVMNLYPSPQLFSAVRQQAFSGSAKMNHIFAFGKSVDAQLAVIYLAPDIIPQGRIGGRFSIDLGIKKSIQQSKGELFANATDMLNTLVVRKEIQGSGFRYTSTDYNETQMLRMGYSYKF